MHVIVEHPSNTMFHIVVKLLLVVVVVPRFISARDDQVSSQFESDLFEIQLNTLSNYFHNDINNKSTDIYLNDDDNNNSKVIEALLPPLWDQVPTLDQSNFEQDNQGRLIIDVWNYTNRMSLYKYLITNINHCEWNSTRTDDLNLNAGSILWGLPLQHGWQFSSGRLYVPENR